MNFIKNRLFSRKSGIRHLVVLLLGAFVLAWSYVVMAMFQEDWHWLERLYYDSLGGWEPVFYGVVGTAVGAAALMGALIYKCAEKFMLHYFLRFFYSVLDVIPIVNVIVPLIYQHRLRKLGRDSCPSGAGVRVSLQQVTYNALVANNIVLHPNGKLKFGIIRYVFASTFRLIGGLFLLVIALLVPVLTPAGVLLAMVPLAILSDIDITIVYWIGVAAAGLTALILVIHPLIALLLNPRPVKAAKPTRQPEQPAPEPEPPAVETPEPESIPAPEPAPAEDLPEPEPLPPAEEPEPTPALPSPEPEPDAEIDVQYVDPVVRLPETKDLIEVTEHVSFREIENHKEKEI